MAPPLGAAPVDRAGAAADLAAVRERLRWLVRLRWVAIGGVLAATAAGAHFRVLSAPWPLVSVAGTMAAANAAWAVRLGRSAQASVVAGERLIAGQIAFDLVALAALLGLSGGGDNPFAVLFAFHMAIGAMLLPPLVAARIGFFGAFLYTALVLVQRGGLLPVVPLVERPLPPTLGVVAGRIVSMTFMMLGVVYFVQSIAERLRRAEQLRLEHERVALSRARFARVGELSAGVAHAIRNPLHGLLSSVELLGARLGAGADPDTTDTLDLMTEALRRIETITQRLLDLTRDAPLVRVPTDLDELASETLRLVSPRIRGSAAQLDADLGGVGECDLDPVHFEEALANVLNNAIDACSAGGRVVLRTAPGPDPASTVVVEVRDTGTGIAPGDLGSVFAPFFTTKAVGEGTGLGLAITRRIIEEHGGRVTVESTLGEGTNVRFVLPRRSQESSAEGDGA